MLLLPRAMVTPSNNSKQTKNRKHKKAVLQGCNKAGEGKTIPGSVAMKEVFGTD